MSELARLDSFEPFCAEPQGALHRYLLLDVFALRAMEGNQLAVFTDASGLDGETMQRVALELRLSETVFLLAPADGADARVRIFTPAVELPFAGHPVLGAAAVVGRGLGLGAVRLETGSGEIRVQIEPAGGQATFGRMSQPVPSVEPFTRAGELLAAVGVSRSGLPVEVYRNGPSHIYVELESPAAVAALQPDQPALAAAAGEAGVSCFAGAGSAYRSRTFAPGLGVAEDPATGSAAGPLAVHLLRHGRIAYGQEIEISQGRELGRPSRLLARVLGSDGQIEDVQVAGQAVIVGRGELLLG